MILAATTVELKLPIKEIDRQMRHRLSHAVTISLQCALVEQQSKKAHHKFSTYIIPENTDIGNNLIKSNVFLLPFSIHIPSNALLLKIC